VLMPWGLTRFHALPIISPYSRLFSCRTPKIITHDQAENEPTRPQCALQCAADLRFSDARIIAHRNFNQAISGQRTFENHLNRPAISGFFEGKRAQYVCSGGAERAEVAYLETIKNPNQKSGEMIAKCLMPGQRPIRISLMQT